MDPRLRAVCDLTVATARELAGRHEYDGKVQDLSPEGVGAGLAHLGRGDRLPDTHDEAHLRAFEDSLRVELGDLQLHRRNPLFHLANLDLACYDREYGPEEERAEARRAHIAAWPDAVDAAVAALDQVSAPIATALLDAVRGLASAIPAEESDLAAHAREAHGRLVAHVRHAAEHGDPDPALGGGALAQLMGTSEAVEVDLGRLAERADAERDRLMGMMEEACRHIDPERPALDLTRYLVLDHPDATGVLEEARLATREVIDFTRERNLVPYLDGQCFVGPAPPTRRFAMAMMAWSAPEETDAPSWYHITPPDPSWPTEDIDDWLAVFSRTMLPAITAHEVAPGHFAHGRALRRGQTAVRRVLQSPAFAEGWAHYAEELLVEEKFHDDDPRFVVGVCAEALIRVTRLACAIGVHTGVMTVEDAARRFSADTHIAGQTALSEARRAAFDPTYGRYTWGKLVIRDLREQARIRWGGYSHLRFHTAMLDLGSPPLGLLGTALERG